jgi:hypothetical protein
MANKTPGMRQMRGMWGRSCEADIDKLCHGVPAGRGKVLECLKSHSDQLSPPCKTALENRARQRAAAATTPGAAAPATPATAATASPAAHKP